MTRRQLAAWFAAEVLKDYYQWKARPSTDSHAGTRYRGEFTKCGSVVAGVKKLLDSPSNGRKVVKNNDLGAEYHVVNPAFKRLFSQRYIDEAQRRIDAVEAR